MIVNIKYFSIVAIKMNPPRLVLTGKNYYDCKTIADAQGIGISASYEELAMQLAYENAGIDPGQEETFNDLFGRNEDKIYIWQWTRNGLRVPTGQEPEKYETDKRGRKRWKRIFLEGDKEVAELWVPEGNDHVVTEWNELFGVPAATEDISWPHKPYTTHFVFNTNPKKDDISGHYDVAVGRRGDWHPDVHRWCLGVGAGYGWDALSYDGFRPVRGSAPKIEVVSSKC